MKRHYIYFQLLFLAAVMLTGCVKRELELPEGETVRINYDWTHLQDKQKAPSSMKLLFYGEDGSFKFMRNSSSDFFQESLPEGTYRVLIFNTDATGVEYRDMNTFNEAQIYALPKQDSDNLESAHNLYGVSMVDLTVHSGQHVEVSVVPHLYVRSVILKLQMIGNTSEIVASTATLSGVATILNMSTGIPVSGSNASVSNSLLSEGEYYSTLYNLIGDDEYNSNTLSIDLLFADGTKKTLKENVTESMELLNQQEEGISLVIELVIDVQVIDGVITASIKDWNYKKGNITVQ